MSIDTQVRAAARAARRLAAATALAAAPATAQTTLASSTFDTDADGWRTGDLYGVAVGNPSTYVATGGNPGGFIRTNDASNIAAYIAPAAYLGDKSAAFGGSLRLDMRIDLSSNTNLNFLRISDGTLNLYYYGPEPVPDVWTTFVVPFVAGAGWRVGALGSSPAPGTGTLATAAQLQQVLSNLTQLRILADQHNGGDRTDVDNVTLVSATPVVSAVPEPSSVALMASGALALGAAAVRRRRTSGP